MKRSKFGILTMFLAVAVCTPSVAGQIISSAPPAGKPAPKVEPTPTVEPLATNDPNELLKAALDLYTQKKYDEVIANASKAQVLAPNDFRPPYLIGLAYGSQRKLKSASEYLAKSLALKPNKQIYLQKANFDRFRNANEDALEACREALKIDPSYAPAYLMIGEILRFDEKRRDEGIAALRSAIKIDPNLLLAYSYLGDALIQAKDKKGAEEIFRKAMEVDPKRMAGRFELGRELVEQGRLEEARQLWEGRTEDKDDTFPNFITVLERAEKLQRAQKAFAAKPNDPATLVEIGVATMDGDSWVVDGRQERAIEYFRKALKLKPGYALAQYNICKAFIQIADTFKDKNKNVDQELAKLKTMDSKLAAELVEYRKTYQGGLSAAGDLDQ